MREREPFFSLFMYRLFKWSIIVPTFRTALQGKVYGRENVPLKGGVVVVSNHASDFDPPLLGSSMGRPVAFMAKEELFAVPLLKTAIRWYGAYPVKRGHGDRAAIRQALEFLENGWMTGVFLEGTRTVDGRVTDPKLGAALIAAKAKVPILPVSLWGTHAILPKNASRPHLAPVSIRFGELMAAPTSSDREELEAITQQCTQAVNKLHGLGR